MKKIKNMLPLTNLLKRVFSLNSNYKDQELYVNFQKSKKKSFMGTNPNTSMVICYWDLIGGMKHFESIICKNDVDLHDVLDKGDSISIREINKFQFMENIENFYKNEGILHNENEPTSEAYVTEDALKYIYLQDMKGIDVLTKTPMGKHLLNISEKIEKKIFSFIELEKMEFKPFVDEFISEELHRLTEENKRALWRLFTGGGNA